MPLLRVVPDHGQFLDHVFVRSLYPVPHVLVTLMFTDAVFEHYDVISALVKSLGVGECFLDGGYGGETSAGGNKGQWFVGFTRDDEYSGG